jgi:hypothetical protein
VVSLFIRIMYGKKCSQLISSEPCLIKSQQILNKQNKKPLEYLSQLFIKPLFCKFYSEWPLNPLFKQWLNWINNNQHTRLVTTDMYPPILYTEVSTLPSSTPNKLIMDDFIV